ncbi:MAG: hypothetical protein JNL24_07350 [Bacteroidia bacterium]|nr:hypothetical protein [Bacteroidia bacterium]
MVNWELILDNVIRDGAKYLAFCFYLYLLNNFTTKDTKDPFIFEWFERKWWGNIVILPLIVSFVSLFIILGIKVIVLDYTGKGSNINYTLSKYLTWFFVGIIFQLFRWKLYEHPFQNFKKTDEDEDD